MLRCLPSAGVGFPGNRQCRTYKLSPLSSLSPPGSGSGTSYSSLSVLSGQLSISQIHGINSRTTTPNLLLEDLAWCARCWQVTATWDSLIAGGGVFACLLWTCWGSRTLSPPAVRYLPSASVCGAAPASWARRRTRFLCRRRKEIFPVSLRELSAALSSDAGSKVPRVEVELRGVGSKLSMIWR